MMLKGDVVHWAEDGRYGFIRPRGTEDRFHDVYFTLGVVLHAGSLRPVRASEIRAGMNVAYEATATGRNGKSKASVVHLTNSRSERGARADVDHRLAR